MSIKLYIIYIILYSFIVIGKELRPIVGELHSTFVYVVIVAMKMTMTCNIFQDCLQCE